jgi:hypothetical protein
MANVIFISRHGQRKKINNLWMIDSFYVGLPSQSHWPHIAGSAQEIGVVETAVESWVGVLNTGVEDCDYLASAVISRRCASTLSENRLVSRSIVRSHVSHAVVEMWPNLLVNGHVPDLGHSLNGLYR